MAEAPRRRPKPPPPDRLAQQLAAMSARPPTLAEVSAIRALMRGHADAGQQRLAVSYLMEELCGAGRVPFAGENTQGTAFRAGSFAVGIALAAIADVAIMRFPDDESLSP